MLNLPGAQELGSVRGIGADDIYHVCLAVLPPKQPAAPGS